MKTLILLLGFLFPTAGFAQSYSIDWFKVSGGGGTSSNGQYVVSGTIGQHDAGGPMIGGNYSLTGGFWGIISVVQTPGAPLLTIHLTGPNTAVVSWPSPSTGYVLLQNTDISTSNWTTNGLTPADDGTNKSVTLTPTTGNLFLRLKQ